MPLYARPNCEEDTDHTDGPESNDRQGDQHSAPDRREIDGSEEKRQRHGDSVVDRFHVEEKIDVLDSIKCWSEAVIIKVCHQTSRIFITYLFWEDKWDEWLNEVSIILITYYTTVSVDVLYLKLG